MAADVDEQDFVLGDLQSQGNAVAVGKADGLETLELTGEGVQAQLGLEGVFGQLFEGCGEAGAQVGVLAQELGRYGIRANGIAPGLTRTDFSRATWSNPDLMKHIEASLPLGRIAESEDLVGAALFLASAASRRCLSSSANFSAS